MQTAIPTRRKLVLCLLTELGDLAEFATLTDIEELKVISARLRHVAREQEYQAHDEACQRLHQLLAAGYLIIRRNQGNQRMEKLASIDLAAKTIQTQRYHVVTKPNTGVRTDVRLYEAQNNTCLGYNITQSVDGVEVVLNLGRHVLEDSTPDFQPLATLTPDQWSIYKPASS